MDDASTVIGEILSRAPIAVLRARYDEPWRHYHAWHHPMAMLRHLECAVAAGVPVSDQIAAVGFVLWHDAVYDPQAALGRNEQLSAELCRAEFVAIAGPASVASAEAMILATIDHRVPPNCPDAALLLDIDLSILGADWQTFTDYDSAIAREYAHVPAERYRAARSDILNRFVERDRLFVTRWAFDRWETKARANLASLIAART